MAVGFLCLVEQSDFVRWAAPITLLAVGSVALIQPLWTGYTRFSESWTQAEAAYQGMEVEVTDEGVEFASPHRRSFLRWQAFTQLIETRRVFLLLTTRDDVTATIPKRSFPTPAELDEFRRLVKAHLAGPSQGFPVVVRSAS